jgi:hypothetical protein
MSGTMHTAPLTPPVAPPRSLFNSDDDSDKLDWDCLRRVEKNGHIEREAAVALPDAVPEEDEEEAEEVEASISDATVAGPPEPPPALPVVSA